MLQNYLEDHPKKHLIFDFDETLFTLLLPWEKYIAGLTEKLLQLDPSLKEFTHHKTLNDLENEAVRRHDEAAITLRREYSTEFEDSYLQGVEEHKALTNFIREHAHDLNEMGTPKYNFYLWTTNMRTTVEPILIKKSMIQYFKQLVTKSEVKLTKPEAEGFYMLFDADTQKKEDFLMIGDSVNDEGAARNVGIEFYSVKPEVTQW